MELDALRIVWKKLGYDLETKNLGTMNPCVLIKNDDALITITIDNTKITSEKGVFWTEDFDDLIYQTIGYLKIEKLKCTFDRLDAAFTKSYFSNTCGAGEFEAEIEDEEFVFDADDFCLKNKVITPEKLRLINKIAKVLEWEVDE